MDASETPLRDLPGIGQARASSLASSALHTVWDLLHALPRCLGEPPPVYDSGPPPVGAHGAGDGAITLTVKGPNGIAFERRLGLNVRASASPVAAGWGWR